ncbi:MAG: flagellar motor protein MotA [Moraxellaceae bacterium]|jgi:biopolymer transport protein ExbB/TolQ|nr:flagellar motor protein MotA [Moraxellaceae bacterium]
MNMFQSFASFMQEGGVWMYPILLTLVAGIAISIERWLYLSKVERVNKELWAEAFALVSKGQVKAALEKTKVSDSALGIILTNGLTRLVTSRKMDDVEMAMEEGLMESLPRLEKRTHYLSTLANVATLLGLLGTIIGLIHAFTAVASADPAEKANLLSAAVGEAMNCTAFGLIAAIPMLVMFSLLQSKTGAAVESLEAASVKFQNVIRQIGNQQTPQQ